jgi:hypothetical protein
MKELHHQEVRKKFVQLSSMDGDTPQVTLTCLLHCIVVLDIEIAVETTSVTLYI